MQAEAFCEPAPETVAALEAFLPQSLDGFLMGVVELVPGDDGATFREMGAKVAADTPSSEGRDFHDTEDSINRPNLPPEDTKYPPARRSQSVGHSAAPRITATI